MGPQLLLPVVMAAALVWMGSLYSGSSVNKAPARTVAAALIEHHQAAVAAVIAAPSLTGTVTPTMPWWKPAGPFASCADAAGVVVTYSTANLYPSADRVAMELPKLVADAAGYGLSKGGIVQQRTGAGITLPCSVPDGLAVAVTRTRG